MGWKRSRRQETIKKKNPENPENPVRPNSKFKIFYPLPSFLAFMLSSIVSLTKIEDTVDRRYFQKQPESDGRRVFSAF
jgi:hypothetical protein